MRQGETVVDALGVALGLPAGAPPALTALFPRHPAPSTSSILVADASRMVSAFTSAAIEQTDLLGIHAGVVGCSSGAVAIPGHSGFGKSTLTAALVQVGFGYVSDEVLAIDRRTGNYTAFPRPITLDQQSLNLLGLDDVVVAGTEEAAVDPRGLGALAPTSGSLSTVVLASRKPGLDCDVAFVHAPGEAAAALIASSFNHYRWPASAIAAIAGVVRNASVVRVVYNDARTAAEALRTLL